MGATDTLAFTDARIADQFIGHRGFKTEKNLCEYVEDNAELFAQDILHDRLVRFKREAPMVVAENRGSRCASADFLFECVSNTYLIECKNPTNVFTELSRSLSQLLSYGVLAKINFDIDANLVLVTGKHDPIIATTIDFYALPIGVVLLTKDANAVFNREAWNVR